MLARAMFALSRFGYWALALASASAAWMTFSEVRDAAQRGRMNIEASRWAADHPCYKEHYPLKRIVICYKGPSKTTTPSLKDSKYWWPAINGATVTVHN